jgi:hypothetical protein
MMDEEWDDSAGGEESENEVPNAAVKRVGKQKKVIVSKPNGSALGLRRPNIGYNPTTTFLSSNAPNKLKRRSSTHNPRPLKLQMDVHAFDRMKSVKFKVPTFTRPLGNGMGAGIRPGTNLGMRRARNPIMECLYDATAPDAIILYEPKKKLTPAERMLIYSKKPGQAPDYEVEVMVGILL